MGGKNVHEATIKDIVDFNRDADDLQYINTTKSKCCGKADCKCTFASWISYKVAKEPKGMGFYEWLDGR